MLVLVLVVAEDIAADELALLEAGEGVRGKLVREVGEVDAAVLVREELDIEACEEEGEEEEEE